MYPNVAQHLELSDMNQLWLADLTFVRLEQEFVYVAVVLDAGTRVDLKEPWRHDWKSCPFDKLRAGSDATIRNAFPVLKDGAFPCRPTLWD